MPRKNKNASTPPEKLVTGLLIKAAPPPSGLQAIQEARDGAYMEAQMAVMRQSNNHGMGNMGIPSHLAQQVLGAATSSDTSGPPPAQISYSAESPCYFRFQYPMTSPAVHLVAGYPDFYSLKFQSNGSDFVMELSGAAMKDLVRQWAACNVASKEEKED